MYAFYNFVDVCFWRLSDGEAAGATIEEIIEWFDVTREQVSSVLETPAAMQSATHTDK